MVIIMMMVHAFITVCWVTILDEVNDDDHVDHDDDNDGVSFTYRFCKVNRSHNDFVIRKHKTPRP